MNGNIILPFNPDAGKKVLALRENFIAAIDVSGDSYTGRARLKMPITEVSLHARRIMDAMLSGFKTMDRLAGNLFPKDGFRLVQHPIDAELKADLREAFISYRSLRRGQPSYGVIGPVFADAANVRYQVMHYNAFTAPPGTSARPRKAFVAIEAAPDAVNLCITATGKNRLEGEVELIADSVYRLLKRSTSPIPASRIAGKPVQVFLHTPQEASLASESFALVHSVNRVRDKKDGTAPELVRLDALPIAIEYGFFKHADNRENLPNPAMAALRGFALRTYGMR